MVSLSLLSYLAAPAYATPDRKAAEVEDAASTGISHLAAHADTGWALALTPAGLRAIDLESWEVQAVSTCTSPAGLAVWPDGSGDLYVFVGCATGEIEQIVLGSDRDVDTALSQTVQVADGAVLGLGVIDEQLWVVSEGADATEVRAVSVTDLESVGIEPSNLAQDAVVDVDVLSAYLLVLHGNDDLSRVDASTGAASLPQENLPGRDFVDMATWGASGVFLAADNGALIRYVVGSTDDLQILLDDEDGLSSLESVATDPAGEWLVVSDRDQAELLFFALDTQNYAVEDETLERIDLSAEGSISRMVAVGDVLLAATADGRLLVFTALPWVDLSLSPATTLGLGDPFTVEVSADTAGDWSLRFGSPTGDELASGELEADTPAAVELTVDEGFGEGRNRLYLVLDTVRGQGVYAVDVQVDNPPGRVQVVSVGFSDETILLELKGDGAEDLAQFDVYLTTEAFTAEDWPDGGPAYAGPDDGVSSPTSAEVEDPTATLDVTLTGLTNGTQYYLGVRAVDEAGTEGPMSDVFTATPAPTLGAADLAQETGGHCGVRPGSAPDALALLGLGLLRRRAGGLRAGGLRVRGLRSAAALCVGLGLLGAPAAQAGDDTAEPVKGRRVGDVDQRVSRDTEFRVGPLALNDENIAAIYGTSGFIHLGLQSGAQLFRVLELDGGVGLSRRAGTLVASDGTASTEDGKLTVIPLSATATLRLDLFDGQPIVPYASVGLDYWLWREREGTPTVETMFEMDATSGGKLGYHYALGANLLLDWADPVRADGAHARWGIHDTYLVAEWRKNEQITPDGLQFDGSALTVGVKIDR